MLLCSTTAASGLVVVPEAAWRARADAHSDRVRRLLSPGFVPAERVTRARRLAKAADSTSFSEFVDDGFRALDRNNPVVNFLQ